MKHIVFFQDVIIVTMKVTDDDDEDDDDDNDDDNDHDYDDDNDDDDDDDTYDCFFLVANWTSVYFKERLCKNILNNSILQI